MEVKIDTRNATTEAEVWSGANDSLFPDDREAVCDSKRGTPAPEIHKLDPLGDPRWQPFVEQHPNASVFHTTGWLKALNRTYGYRPVVFTNSSPTEELKNGLLFCQIQSWITGSRLVS